MKHLQRSITLVIALCACQKNAAVVTVTGTVRFSADLGPIELPESVRKVCGEHLDAPFRPAVVWVKDAAATAATKTPLLDQKRCAYEPAVLVGHTGGSLKVKNSDPLMHNVRAAEGERPRSSELFNVGMPIENQVIERKLPDSTGSVKIVCDVHPWMRADVLVLPHEQYAVTDAEGNFRIDGVTAGPHTLTIWHPTAGQKDVAFSGEGKVDTSLP